MKPTSPEAALLRLNAIGCSYLVLALLNVSTAGCAEDSGTIPVQGQVTYRGEPLGAGVVTFFPTRGRPVSAAVSAAGDYRVELQPGDYTVTVRAGTEIPPGYKEGDPIPPPKIALPPEYTSRARSKLTAKVDESGGQTVDFELE
jgi:hypothetical protein